MTTTESVGFALFDAGLLTEPQRQRLHAFDDVVWGYADIPDPQAAAMGPAWLPLNESVKAFVAEIWADESCTWAASVGEVSGSFAKLSRHFRELRFTHTHDNQRYFFRFADTRCLAAMVTALGRDRFPRLMGPILRWEYQGREGHAETLKNDPELAARSQLSLRLRAPELAALLDASWPDQLLSSALDADPTLGVGTAPRDRYQWARQLCTALKEHQVDAYPVQVEAMLLTMRSLGAVLKHPKFADVLVSAQQQKAPELLSELRITA